jgi:hypothetical protein
MIQLSVELSGCLLVRLHAALMVLLSEWWAFEVRLARKVATVFRVLKGPSVGWCNSGKVPTSTLGTLFVMVPNLKTCHVCFYTVLIPQAQLRHLYWLVSIQSADNLLPQVPQVLRFMSHRNAVTVIDTH